MANGDTYRFFKNKVDYCTEQLPPKDERPLRNAEGPHPMTTKQDKSKNTKDDSL